MKKHTYEVNEETVTAYNDSGIEWVIKSTNHSVDRFPVSKWALKDAVEFYIKLYQVGE
jgi:hypothetical protein